MTQINADEKKKDENAIHQSLCEVHNLLLHMQQKVVESAFICVHLRLGISRI